MTNNWNSKIKVGLALAMLLALAVTIVALAENVKNDVVAGGNDTFTAGGSTTINYWIQDTGQPNTCEAADGTTVTVTIITPSGVTASPSSLTFSVCNTSNENSPTNTQGITFSSSTPGNYSISATASDTGDPSAYNTSPAAFTLHVEAAPPPSDTTAPIISYVLSPSSPDGSNGWYKSDVTLTWTVTENESPGSLVKTGCVNQNITADQAETTYSCSATSTGGSAGPVEVKIKRDATAPTGVSGAPNRSPDNGTWYNHAVGVLFAGADVTSGIASCSTVNYSGPDGAGVTVNGTCTDNAGNVSAPVASSAFNYDGTGPSATLAVSAGTAGANGWYISDVTVSTSGSDAVSGPVTCTGDQYQTSETAGAVFNGSCTNAAGLTTNAAPLTVKLDKTGPSAALAVAAGTLGSNGWYTSDVTVSTSGSDSISGPVTCTADQFQTTETTGAVFNGSCTNDAGLSTNAAPLTVKLDKSGPTAALAVTAGTLGSNGWYTSDVTVSTSGSDSISGPVTCTADQFQTTETTGAVFNGSCTNDAGLTTNTAPLTVKLDKSGPSAALAVTAGTLGLNGWYTSDVTVSTSGSDSISSPVACTSDQFQTTETTGAVFNGSCTNDAGLITNAAPLTVKLDKTGPSASLSVTAGTLGTNSWYVSDVTVGTSGTDSISSPVTCTADQFQITDTASATFNGSCTNDAGLTTNAVPLTIKRDATPPVVSITCPSSPIILGSSASAGWTASDALSGLATSASGTVALDTSTVGSKTATAPTATDNAGNNSSPSTCSYSVVYNWNGFFQPVDNLPVLNKVKAGQAIPIKFSLSGYQGLGIFAAGYPVSTVTTCGSTTTDTIESTVTAGGSSLSYDPTTDQYIYVWKTDKLWAGSCRTLTVKLVDGTIHQANFNFTK